MLYNKKRPSEDNRLRWWTMTGSNCRHPACKAGALPAELIVHMVTRPGIEPGIPPWKGGVLTAWPTGQNGSSSRTRTYDRSVNSRLLYRLSYRGTLVERETRFELATPALARRCSTAELFPHVHGASGQNRTVDTRIFSPLLYQLSYRGMNGDPDQIWTDDLRRDRATC